MKIETQLEEKLVWMEKKNNSKFFSWIWSHEN